MRLTLESLNNLKSFLLTKSRYLTKVCVLLLTVTCLFFFTNAQALAQTQIAALGASDSAVSNDETDLKMTPSGKHYSGLEYAERTQANENPVSDNVIQKSIESKADSGVVVAVANGSVRLSGRVDNKEEAENLIATVKKIPGVHEITFDLGLNQ